MCQCILLSEDAPHAFLIIYITVIKLMGLHFLKLPHKLLVDGKVLYAVGSG